LERLIVGKAPKEYLPQLYEEKILEWWEENEIYEKVKNRMKGKPKFYFLDGPPYVTNPPHAGTAWNKILKDAIIRFKRMQGYDVRDQPGYDCHGLPIEVKVEEDLKVKRKKEIEEIIKIENFIERCKQYAIENANIQTTIFKNLGVWMDWGNPYITFKDEYIESAWWTIKKAEEKGLLQKGLKVVHWCPRCETALAGYEVTDEYRVVKDYSIYVKFPILGREKEYILIWTTTPWTLPANVAVMVHPDYYYVKAKADDEVYVLAETRCEQVFREIGKPYEILESFKGSELEGIKYKPPLLEETAVQSQLQNAHKVILSREYVSMEEGTGCVHCAPGHGEEDFEAGLKYNLPIVSPVDPAGVFTLEAGKYAGKHVAAANKDIAEDLRRKGLLLYETIIEHSYPHCWRCKTPLLLRATEQWFIKVTEFKDKLLEENEKIRWVPEWAGTKRFKDWLLGARDWVISRQRYWGTPLPIWICEKCGKRIVVESKEELKSKAVNFPKALELHRPYVDAILLRCGCGGYMRRVPDIIDVWMDSGVAGWACLEYPRVKDNFEKWWPADLVLEAHDQTRGWFYTQLVAGIVAFDRRPYEAVLMHGHTLDASGQKFSKSLGNFISPEEVIAKYGRDSIRLYELQCAVWEDFRFSWSEVEETWKVIQIIWNIFVFASLYMNLDRFSPSSLQLENLWSNMRPEDRWLISKTEGLKIYLAREMANLNVHLASRALIKYALEDVSRWYVKLVRRRFWQERESLDKKAAYSALYYALKNWLILSAPFMPFICEKLYQTVIKPAETKALESIHMYEIPKPNVKWLDPTLEEEMEILKEITSAAASARQSLKIKLRQPVYRVIVITDNPGVRKAVEKLKNIVLEQANAKKLEVISVGEEKKLKEVTVTPKYEALGPAFKAETPIIADAIKMADGKAIFESFRKAGSFELAIGEKRFNITPDMVSFKEEMPKNFALGTFSQGRVYVDATLPKALLEEGLVRDVVRRLQEMRRTMNLPVDGFVTAYILTPAKMEKTWLEKRRDYIKEEIRAKRLYLLERGEKKPKVEFEKTWIINGKPYEMGLKLLTQSGSN
jgi:isoleucyl-tRNA synthetase